MAAGAAAALALWAIGAQTGAPGVVPPGSVTADSGGISAERVDDGESAGLDSGHGETEIPVPQGEDVADPRGLADIASRGWAVHVQEGETEEVAAELLRSYRDGQLCILVSSGYLDLLGEVWSCVVRGDRWVDVCVVSPTGDGKGCEVSVLHMTEGEVAELLEGEEVGDGA